MAKRVYTFPEEVTLIDKNPDTGEETKRISFAQISSVYARETYAAMAVGLRPEFIVTLPNWEDDYHGEQSLIRDCIPYRIIRAFHTPDGMAELTVTRLKNYVSESGMGGSV